MGSYEDQPVGPDRPAAPACERPAVWAWKDMGVSGYPYGTTWLAERVSPGRRAQEAVTVSMTPALRELLAVAAETADVPHPANWEDREAWTMVMTSRLNSLHVILASLSRETGDWNARQLRGQADLLREWLERSPATYAPFRPPQSQEG